MNVEVYYPNTAIPNKYFEYLNICCSSNNILPSPPVQYADIAQESGIYSIEILTYVAKCQTYTFGKK